MAWRGRILVGLSGLLLAGGVSGCIASGNGGTGSAGVGSTAAGRLVANEATDEGLRLAANLEPVSAPEAAPRLARSQLPDSPVTPVTPVTPAKPSAADKAPGVLPPLPAEVQSTANPLLPVSGTVGAERAAALLEKSELRVKVRAWVNGRPIFEDEMWHTIGPAGAELNRLNEPARTEKLLKLIKQATEHLVDEEVMYQDAIRKLEKGNPQALKMIKKEVHQDFEKSLQKMRAAGLPADQIKLYEPVLRRMAERTNISSMYLRNQIWGYVQGQVTLAAIQTYYQEHKNEFQTVDKVEWQDVFIAVGAKHPTPADAKRFAEELIGKCRTPEDFAKLHPYDEGDSKFRGGAGFGQRRGEIRPPELEPHLFALKEGQIGPVVELPTGAHIFCVTKREYAGQLPLTDQTQKAIRRKLENQVAEREAKQLVRSLRARSVIRIVLDGL